LEVFRQAPGVEGHGRDAVSSLTRTEDGGCERGAKVVLRVNWPAVGPCADRTAACGTRRDGARYRDLRKQRCGAFDVQSAG
jgi:hypothetical protein